MSAEGKDTPGWGSLWLLGSTVCGSALLSPEAMVGGWGHCGCLPLARASGLGDAEGAAHPGARGEIPTPRPLSVPRLEMGLEMGRRSLS